MNLLRLGGLVLAVAVLLAPVAVDAQPIESQKASLAKMARQAGKDCKKVTFVGLPEVSRLTDSTVMPFVCDGYKHYAAVIKPDGSVYVADQAKPRR